MDIQTERQRAWVAFMVAAIRKQGRGVHEDALLADDVLVEWDKRFGEVKAKVFHVQRNITPRDLDAFTYGRVGGGGDGGGGAPGGIVSNGWGEGNGVPGGGGGEARP